MGVEETKQDLWLKRAQITVAILAGLATLIVGIYNVKKTLFSETSKPGGLALVLRSDTGQFINDARVEVYDAQNALDASGETDASGVFKKEGLPAGSYLVRIAKDGFEPQVYTVRVQSKVTSDLKFVLRPIVRGQTPAGNPIRSALEEAGASWIKTIAKPKTDGAESK